ncbi:RING finger protein 214 [Pelobates fuscus]|uniref:RING finger protein 214 n=1 Tax=Pelobates fuscus TaxID=191477 RepID=UPI002FE43C7C
MAEGDATYRLVYSGMHMDGENCIQSGNLSHCVGVQTEHRKQDAGTITDRNTEHVLKELVNHRDQVKDSYQEVLDKQTQAEKQLQVQIKQLKQQRDEEISRHQDTLKAVQDVTVKREETKKRMAKERKDHSQKEQDLRSELEKLQAKSKRLQQERDEMENKVQSLLEEQTHEKEEWDSELASLKKLEDEITQSVQQEKERVIRAEVLALESRRDLLLFSIEEAESEAEVTLSLLRVANPTIEWIQLKQKWEARLAGIKQIKTNLWDQFVSHIQQVKDGTKLGSLPSIAAPSLPPPPSDTNLLLQRIALAPQMQSIQMQPPVSTRDLFHLPPQLSNALSCQPSVSMPHIPVPFGGATNVFPRAAASTVPTSAHSESSAPPGTDKLSKILEKLQARFPKCTKSQLTGIMQQIKMSRGTLSGLTVEQLCQHVATRLKETDVGTVGTLPAGNSRLLYHTPQGLPSLVLPAQMQFAALPPQPSAPCKLCLICQKIVLPTDMKPMPCSHILHKKCTQFWSSINQTDCCPFCPSQNNHQR